MKRQDPAQLGSGDAPTSQSLLASPLDFIAADHSRERKICAVIEALAMAPALDRETAMSVLRFLNEELNVHLRDEVEDLFPLLAQRCTEEDSIDGAISRVMADQHAAMGLLPDVRRAIARCLDTGADLTAGDRALLTALAGHVRGHLVAGNAILLPIARARLTQPDLQLLSERMRTRRGLPHLAEFSDAE